MRTFLFLTVFSVLLVGCEKSQDNTPNEAVEPFVLRAGEVDADSTIYSDFIPDRELFFESDVWDTINHFDTLSIDFDMDSLDDFSIVIEHRQIGGLVMYVSGYIVNENDISFANYYYGDGLAEGDTINENLNWDNSDELEIFIWSSGSNPSWISSYFIAFKFTVNGQIKYGWLNTIWEAYVDEYASYISSFRYSLIDLAIEK